VLQPITRLLNVCERPESILRRPRSWESHGGKPIGEGVSACTKRLKIVGNLSGDCVTWLFLSADSSTLIKMFLAESAIVIQK
jgi:hypothetical protein